MSQDSTDKYSAGEQGLGYMYQARLALLELLQLPENTVVLLEKDDDIDFVEVDGLKTLSSLKHKAEGDRLTDLSTDFWKSVNIWLVRYGAQGKATSNLRFHLLTTAIVGADSILKRFTAEGALESSDASDVELIDSAISRSESKTVIKVAALFSALSEAEKEDFLSRIEILDASPRITDVPALIMDKLRSIRREYRQSVYERLEGWWNDQVINQLAGLKPEGTFGYELSDKLQAIAEEYKEGNLPITFYGKLPPGEIDTDNDPRLFVKQLRAIGLSSERIRKAIIDYYRAFEQRSAWARENLVIAGEVEEYETRLADEWDRYKDVAYESVTDDSADEVLLEAGRMLYNWAEFETAKIEALRIRARVTEPYVARGSFHILADVSPTPRIYWHPRFMSELEKLLAVAT